MNDIHYAAVSGDLEKIKALLKDNPDLVFSKDPNGSETPLHKAAWPGSDARQRENVKDVAELLLANGAEVSAKDKRGDTPLHNAASGGLKDVTELLLANGAEVNAKNDYGETPLHMAAAHNSKDAAELLLARGAKVNAKSKWDRTPLHDAAVYGAGDVAELLLAKGAEVNAKDSKDGSTPLHLVVIFEGSSLVYDHKVVAKLLLANKAEVNVKDNNGHTPLYWADLRYKRKKDMAELLRQHCGQYLKSEKQSWIKRLFGI